MPDNFIRLGIPDQAQLLDDMSELDVNTSELSTRPAIMNNKSTGYVNIFKGKRTEIAECQSNATPILVVSKGFLLLIPYCQ